MKPKTEKIYLVAWTARPNMTDNSRVYVRRSYAQDLHTGLQVGGAVNARIMSFEVGETVRLTRTACRSQRCPEGRGNNRTATIQSFLSDVKGGVFMNRDLKGTRYWNVCDLEKVY